MRYLLIILIAMSAFAREDEAEKLVETSKARREMWKTFREKVSEGDLCRPRDYICFWDALKKIPGVHPEDLIAARGVLETFYLRSINDKTLPCGETCQNNMRASNVDFYLWLYGHYIVHHHALYNFKDSTTVKATRVRAFMDLSAFANMTKQLPYLKSEYDKIDFSKVTFKYLRKEDIKKGFERIENGKLFMFSVLCHLHPGSLVYDEIANGKSKIDAKYAAWLKEFEVTGRKACKDQTPIEYRGMDLSTRKHYDQQTMNKLRAIKCTPGDYPCLRRELRNIHIHYAKDIQRVMQYLSAFFEKSAPTPCDESCKAQNLLRNAQTLITFVSQYDRQKLGSTMDWKKYPEEKFQTLTEDVAMYKSIEGPFTSFLNSLGSIDPAKIKDEGLRSEIKSIAKDVSYFASGEMFKDSVICTMEPWTAAYDKYMTPYKVPKLNKKFEQDFLQFKEQICK